MYTLAGAMEGTCRNRQGLTGIRRGLNGIYYTPSSTYTKCIFQTIIRVVFRVKDWVDLVTNVD